MYINSLSIWIRTPHYTVDIGILLLSSWKLTIARL